MGNTNKAPGHQLVEEVFRCVEVNGIGGTIDILKTARKKQINNFFVDDNVYTVIYAVSSTIGISASDILISRENTEARKVAMGLCIYFLTRTDYFTCHYTLDDIVVFFKKSKSILSRYCNYISDALASTNTKNFLETDIKRQYSEIEQSIKNTLNKRKIK